MTKTTNLLAISALSVALVMFANASQADASIYVKIPGIPGDVTAEGYDDGTWFAADSFQCGIDNTVKKQSGEKGGTADLNIGLGELQECSVSKSMDSASAQLAQLANMSNEQLLSRIHSNRQTLGPVRLKQCENWCLQ